MENLECRNLVKRYGKKEVLKDVSLTLEPGKIYGMIGRNGAGKTTLLSILSAQNPASEGEVLWNGERVWENQKALNHICFSREIPVSTNGNSLSAMKVKEYLRAASYYYPVWDQALADELVEKFGLDVKKDAEALQRNVVDGDHHCGAGEQSGFYVFG